MRRARGVAFVATVVASAAALWLPAPAPAADRAVSIEDRSFVPKDKFVVAGDTVVWTHNDGDTPHTVTRDRSPERFDSSPNCGGLLGSGCLGPGNRMYSRRFDRPGTYAYFCKVHADMSGTIHVAPREAASPSPSPSRTSASPSPSVSGSPAPTDSPGSSPNPSISPTGSFSPEPSFEPTDFPVPDGGSGTAAKAVLAVAALAALGGAGFAIWRRYLA